MSSTAAPPKTLKFAVLGLGRMGKRHARNVAYLTQHATLVAACDPRQEMIDEAKAILPESVKYFQSADEMLKSVELDGVVVSSDSASHVELAIKSLEAGLHVLCEKPISIDLEKTRPVLEAAAKVPKQKVLVGFSRRYDKSYRDAKAALQDGGLGKPYLIKSATNDLYDASGFFVAYSKASGGIYMDCGIHDIDIARWMLNVADSGKKQVNRVYASGLSIRHPELEELGDCDNALGTIEFANGTACTFHLSRTANHGHDCFTEIFGTEGKLVVNGNPTINRVEIRDQHGVRTTSTPTYYERFHEAFVTEINTFVDCILNDKPVPSTLDDGLEAAKIAVALTHAFRTNKPVDFDAEGEAILV